MEDFGFMSGIWPEDSFDVKFKDICVCVFNQEISPKVTIVT